MLWYHNSSLIKIYADNV